MKLEKNKTQGIYYIAHNFPKNKQKFIDALKDYGFKNIVLNPDFKNGFVFNEKNLRDFVTTINLLKENNFNYWIYDEYGYPSGISCTKNLKLNSDILAKGLYLVKYESFINPLRFKYTIEPLSDEIYCAIKYNFHYTTNDDYKINFKSYRLLPHTKKTVKIELKPYEVAYIFVIKTIYNGTQSVHGAFRKSSYINLLNDKATTKFLKTNYYPYKKHPSVLENAEYVFTDEPSLLTFTRDNEVNNEAFIPFDKSILEKFEKKFNYSLKEKLLQLFEDKGNFPKLRLDYYELVGEVVAKNYVDKINDFCKKQNSKLSGHYFGEEKIAEHVINYGNYLTVLKKTAYPGIDILSGIPEKFYPNIVKYVQAISRKNKTDGFMVEYCPYYNLNEFDKNAYENSIATLGLLVLFGARKIPSYASANFSNYKNGKFKNFSSHGISKNEYYKLNIYVDRIINYLQGLNIKNDVYVYYNIADPTAKYTPKHSGTLRRDEIFTKLDKSMDKLWYNLIYNSVDYGIVDDEDLLSLKEIKYLIIPSSDYIKAETVTHLRKLHTLGTILLFIERKPSFIIGNEKIDFGFEINYNNLITLIPSCKEKFGIKITNKNLVISNYDDKKICIYNLNKNPVKLSANKDITVYYPLKNKIEKFSKNKNLLLEAYRLAIINL